MYIWRRQISGMAEAQAAAAWRLAAAINAA